VGGVTAERMALTFPRLPAGFDRLTVAVIADAHLGPRPPLSATEAVRTVNDLHPDLIVLLGDLVHRAKSASRYLPFFAGLRANLGVYACLGNHEHGFFWYSRYLGRSPTPSAAEWRSMYAELGVELLVNEARPLERRGSRIWLVGVDDAYSGSDDLARALDGVDEAEFCLGITHSPDVMDHPLIARLDLVLAGHTHGGQIRLPCIGPIWAPCRRPRERAMGLVRLGSTTLYVTRGVGEGMPIRYRCPREVTFLELGRGPAGSRRWVA